MVFKSVGEAETLTDVNGVELELSDELKEGWGGMETAGVPVSKGDGVPADAFTVGAAPGRVEADPVPVALQRRQPDVALKGSEGAAKETRTEPP
jgi:hypothetical protein